ncbi:hypothetical protein HUW52_00900 [Pseudomonas sp. 43A]|jgi:mannose-1-phosphate guanylyltransferase|uniref:sugar phosphate nucleotidyltransferase n=1 Tax=Pseudomonas TaxID=286 RepID=UPI0015875F27|nr:MULTISPECIES: sugar phosphate nucleotidyltransferase [Pseudomonas]QKV61488.1 hypothetical protein HUW52_00900 [Pseudomonas sp. 43A]QMW10224.1 hypothetical protein H3303_00900 [Pseudomonas sp. 29A]
MPTPVILSGGAGSRLWPVSPECHTAPFTSLSAVPSPQGKTYQCTAAFLAGWADIVRFEDPYGRTV